MGQEEDVRKVIISLDEYNNMTSKLDNMKSIIEKEVKAAENKIKEYYESLIGKGYDIEYIRYRYGTFSRAFSELCREANLSEIERNRFNDKLLECTNRIDYMNNVINTLKKELDEKKKHELYWREMYYMLVEEKKLHWWNIFKRIRLIKRKKKINKLK